MLVFSIIMMGEIIEEFLIWMSFKFVGFIWNESWVDKGCDLFMIRIIEFGNSCDKFFV